MSSSLPRVLHTLDDINISTSGARKFAVELCANLEACGAKVYLVSQNRDYSGKDCNFPHLKHVQTHLAQIILDNERWRITYSPYFSRKVADCCRNESIQIIHDHGLWLPCNYTASRVARRFGIPLVIHPHGMLQPWELCHRAWKKRIAWALYQRKVLEGASMFVVTSEREAESIRRARLAQPIALISIGIDLPAWEVRTPSDRAAFRHALFLSRVHPKKGLLNLASAWDRVRPKGWKMIVAGPDEEHHLDDIKRAVKNSKIENDFEFVGPVAGAAKEKLFRDADLFILPTFSENFGIVVTEALSYGVPVITTHGAPWQALATNGCGWWVEVGAEPLADAIREATSLSETDRYEMGRRGRKLVETKFSWKLIADNTLCAYQWILGIGSKPSCIID